MAEVTDDDDGTETTRTPSRAGVTVSESDVSLDIDMLLPRRLAEIVGSPTATVAMVLMLVGNSMDCMPVLELPGDDDVLLTACTSSMVFCPDALLPTDRLDRTRPLLDTDTTRLLVLLPQLLDDGLLGNDDDADDVDEDAETQVSKTELTIYL